MQFSAKSRFIKYSPFKLRPLADLLRGKNVEYALNWLKTFKTQRTVPLRKTIASAAANAKSRADIDTHKLVIKRLVVDQGPTFRYFKPGAMGRASAMKRPYSHISVIVEQVQNDNSNIGKEV